MVFNVSENDVNGITFDPENPKELSDKIIKLLNKPDIEKTGCV